jgi:hypothetical protein
MIVEGAGGIRLASGIAISSTSLLTFAQIPSPQDFSGWGIHLVLGAVAVAALYVVFRISERNIESVKEQAQSLHLLSKSIDAVAEANRSLANDLHKSPCLMYRIQKDKKAAEMIEELNR